MKANLLALGLFGLAGASAILPRDYPDKYDEKEYQPSKDSYDSKYPEPKYPVKDEYPSKYDEYKQDGYKPDEYKKGGYKEDEYKQGGYKQDGYKEDGYKQDDYKHDEYKQDDYKHDDYKHDDYKHDDYKQDDYKHDKYPSKDYGNKYDEYPSKDDGYKHDDYSKDDGYYPVKYESKYPSKDDDYYTSPEEHDYEDGYSYKNNKGKTSSWKPKSKSPEFFNLRVDEKCDVSGEVPDLPSDCPFNGYAIRLEGGIFIATPYSKWWDPKLPTFFVDDDTQLYTVSKDPLQVYIDGVTGALKYTKIGWLPPNAIAISFYHTGNNPLGLVDPSPSYLSWPSTQGSSFYGSPWLLCPLGGTKQYQVFINNENFGIGGPAGVAKDPGSCVAQNLAAVNANPWKKENPAPYYPPPGGYPGYPGGSGDY